MIKSWLERSGNLLAAKRLLGHFSIFLVIGFGAWAAHVGLDSLPPDSSRADPSGFLGTDATPPAIAEMGIADLPGFAAGGALEAGISRRTEMHTIMPTRPRVDILLYQVQKGDTLFGIAEQYGLKPQSILWGNYDVLKDNPHLLQAGQELKIPPVDGTLHRWATGEGLTSVADYYGVAVQEILDWPGNHLSPDLDPEDSQIEPGTLLIVPGGEREFVSWSAPRIPRSNPSVASILGPGACGAIYDGPIGTQTFIWPTTNHWLSGFDYAPGSNHFGIDIGGQEGNGIFSADAGVVVYAGWHNGGYGNVIVLDHGSGWQTLYAHLSQVNVVCGQGVFQGTLIGLMGSTGRSTGSHLHFEMLHEQYGKVNPWNFLP
jgi:murein DD-endopeptidase MepM/ murein hydrolase activator NlpD